MQLERDSPHARALMIGEAAYEYGWYSPTLFIKSLGKCLSQASFFSGYKHDMFFRDADGVALCGIL
jgi:hypothetical protein